MASVINQIQSNGINYALAHSAFGICETPSDNYQKSVTLCTGGDTTNKDFKLVEGVSVIVKFLYNGFDSHSFDHFTLAALNVNNTGNKPIYYSGTPLFFGSDFNPIKAYHSYQFVYRNSADDAHWELVGDGFLDSEHLVITYNEANNTIDYTYDQVMQYIMLQNAYVNRDNSTLGQAAWIMSKIHVFMDSSGLSLPFMGGDEDNIVFGAQIFNFFIFLSISPDNSVYMEIIPMQLNIDADNPLSANLISGLGSAAFTESNQYAPSSHNHNASNLTAGTLPNDRLPSRLAETNSTANASTIDKQGWHYVSSNSGDAPPFKQVDGQTGNDYRIMTTAYSSQWWQQIATDFRSNDMFIRRNQNGTLMPWTPIVKMQPCSGTNGNVMPTVTNNAIAVWDTSRNATVKNSDVTIITTTSGSDTIVTFA